MSDSRADFVEATMALVRQDKADAIRLLREIVVLRPKESSRVSR